MYFYLCIFLIPTYIDVHIFIYNYTDIHIYMLKTEKKYTEKTNFFLNLEKGSGENGYESACCNIKNI